MCSHILSFLLSKYLSRIQLFILKFLKSIRKLKNGALRQISIGNIMPYLLSLCLYKIFSMYHLLESCRHHNRLPLNTSLPNNAIVLCNHRTMITAKTSFPTLFWIFQDYRKIERMINWSEPWLCHHFPFCCFDSSFSNLPTATAPKTFVLGHSWCPATGYSQLVGLLLLHCLFLGWFHKTPRCL